MPPSQPSDRLLTLFEAASRMPPAKRAAFLDEHCADAPGLREEIEALIDVERAGLGTFLHEPVLHFAAHADADRPYDLERVMTPQRGGPRRSSDPGVDSPPDTAAFADLLEEKQYDIDGELSRGGMGVVLRGRDREFGRPVAIKVMRRELTDSPYLVHRFVREAQINGRLQHPGIVPVYEAGVREDDLPYFSMKLVEGRTLTEVLRERPALADALPIYEQVSQAVAYAHDRGVVHRDLKPANVMVGRFGEVYVLDWGIAKTLSEPEAASPPGERRVDGVEDLASRSGGVVGTLAYMPPEQASGDLGRVGPAADVFALGSMLCELLTGRPAYVGESEVVLRAARSAALAPALQALASCGCDAQLVRLVTDCLRPDPADRPRDAGAVAERIRQHLRSVEERRRQAEIEAAEARLQAAQERRARRLSAALTTVIVVALIGGGATYTWWQDLRQGQRATVAAAADGGLRDAREAFAEGRFGEVLRIAERTRASLRGEHATPDLVERVGAVIEDLAVRASLALDNAALVARIERIRMPESGSPGAPGYRETDWAGIDARYAAAFAAHGIDPDVAVAGGEEASLAAVELRRRDAPEQLVPIVHDWALIRSWAGREVESARLLRLADEVDPDAERTRLRRSVRDRELDALVDFAGSLDAATTPAGTLSLLGHALRQCGFHDVAVGVLRAGCQEHAGDFALNMNLARALMHHSIGGAREAVRHYQAAIAIRPGSVEARHELGRALHMELGRDAEAEGVFRHILDAAPDDQHILYHLGYVLDRLGRRDEAIDVLKQALALDPRDSASLNSLGTIHLREQRHAAAIEAYREAVRVDPGYGVSHANLGLALDRVGRTDEAKAALRRAVECRPDDPGPHGTLGFMACNEGDFEAGVQHLRRAIELDGDEPDVHTNLGYALAQLGDADAAFAAYDRALAIDPLFAKALYNIGTLNLTLGRQDRAERALWRCIAAAPGYVNAYNAIGSTFWGSDWAKVAEVYQVGAERNPGRADFRHYQGEALLAMEQWEPGLDALRGAVDRGAASFDVHFAIGRALVELGRGDEAVEALGRARERASAEQAESVDRLLERARKLR